MVLSCLLFVGSKQILANRTVSRKLNCVVKVNSVRPWVWLGSSQLWMLIMMMMVHVVKPLRYGELIRRLDRDTSMNYC